MELMGAVLAGAAAGLLSGWGLGGGTLLLLWLSIFCGMDQVTAQGVNLLYFLPCATAAAVGHLRRGLLDKKAALPAIGAGLLGVALGAWGATALPMDLLRRIYGLFLLGMGLMELFRRKAPEDRKP